MDIKNLINEQREIIRHLKISTQVEAEEFRIKYLGKEGLLKALSAEIKNIPAELRKETGQMINEFKQFVEGTYEPLRRIIVPETNVFPTKKIEDAIKQENPNLHRTVMKGEKGTDKIEPVKKAVEKKEEWKEPLEKREPDYIPGEKFWTMIGEKPVECWVSSIDTNHSGRAFTITYNGYFSRASVGLEVSGSPDAAPITRKENKMFKTKDLLLNSL